MSRTTKRASQGVQLASVDALFGLDEAKATPIGGDNSIIELMRLIR